MYWEGEPIRNSDKNRLQTDYYIIYIINTITKSIVCEGQGQIDIYIIFI